MMTFILKVLLKISSLKKSKDQVIDPTILTYVTRFGKDLIKPYKLKIAVALIFMAIFSISNAGLAWLIKPIMNQVFTIKSMANITTIGAGIFGISIIKALSQYAYIVILAGVTAKIVGKARENLFNKFLDLDMNFHHKHSPGALTSAIITEVNAINTLATEIPIALGRDFITLVALVVVMLLQEPSYALFVVVIMTSVIIPTRWAKNKIRTAFVNANFGFAEYTSKLEQTFNGIKEVKSYSMENQEKQEGRKIVRNIVNVQTKMRSTMASLPAFTEFLSGLSVAAVLLYGGYMSINYGTDPGSFFSFIAAMLMAYQPFKRLTELNIKLHMGLLGLKRYYSHLDQQPLTLEKPNAQDIVVNTPTIEFKNINFSYNKDENVLKDISFKVNRGQKIALVGQSGSGKTTILSLLLRFYNPNSGKILIDNQDIKDFTIKSIRDSMALVSQDIILFDDTLLNNIRYSKPDATYEEIYDVAKKAHCLDFINAMPKKFETEVGTRGMKLSGGQRQRISIARALLKNSSILLLDEATSALDTSSEKEIQKAFDELMDNRTSIVVAHRLSTIVNSDVIFVLDKGVIVEYGHHNELLKNGGYYKKLYDLQFQDAA